LIRFAARSMRSDLRSALPKNTVRFFVAPASRQTQRPTSNAWPGKVAAAVIQGQGMGP